MGLYLFGLKTFLIFLILFPTSVLLSLGSLKPLLLLFVLFLLKSVLLFKHCSVCLFLVLGLFFFVLAASILLGSNNVPLTLALLPILLLLFFCNFLPEVIVFANIFFHPFVSFLLLLSVFIFAFTLLLVFFATSFLFSSVSLNLFGSQSIGMTLMARFFFMMLLCLELLGPFLLELQIKDLLISEACILNSIFLSLFFFGILLLLLLSELHHSLLFGCLLSNDSLFD